MAVQAAKVIEDKKKKLVIDQVGSHWAVPLRQGHVLWRQASQENLQKAARGSSKGKCTDSRGRGCACRSGAAASRGGSTAKAGGAAEAGVKRGKR